MFAVRATRPLITYKAKKLTEGDQTVKARQELEWQLDPGDGDGTNMESLLQILGFRPIATVTKTRSYYRLERCGRELSVTIDDVQSIGLYAEVECVLLPPNTSPSLVAETRQLVRDVSEELGLQRSETRSYLRLVLAKK